MFDLALRAIGWRTAQQAGVQAIYFLRLLILARLLSPGAFGQLAIAMLIVSTCLSLSDVGVTQALVQREQTDKDEEDAAWTVGVVRAAAIAAAVGIMAPALATLFGDSRTTPIIQALALRPFIAALGSIGVVRLTRQFRFRELAVIQLPGAVIDTCVAIVLASTLGVWALVAGSLAGAAGVTILSYVLAPHAPRLLFRTRAAIPLMQFGRWVLGTSVIGLIASGGVQFVISRRLGVTELGLYFLATKVAFMPADAATTVLGSVAFPLYSSMQRDDARTKQALRTLLTGLALVLFPVYILMIAVAPSVAEVLGPRWEGTGLLIQLIAFAAVLGLYADATLPLHMGRGHPERAMTVVGTQTGVLLIVILPLIAALGVTGAAAAWVPAYASAQLMSLLFVRRTIGTFLAGAGRQLLGILAAAVAGGASAAVARGWLGGTAGIAAGLFCGVLIGGLLLIVVLRRMNLDVGGWLRPAVTESAA